MKTGQFTIIALLIIALIHPAVAGLQSAEKLILEKDYAAALVAVDTALMQMPDDFTAKFMKARILTAQQKTNAAITLYESLIRQAPEQPEPFNNLAMLYAAKGDLETARQLLEKAIKTHQSYATVYDNLSKVYVEMARDSYGKALKMNLAKQSVSLVALNTSPPVGSDVATGSVGSANVTVASAPVIVAQTEVNQNTLPTKKPTDVKSSKIKSSDVNASEVKSSEQNNTLASRTTVELPVATPTVKSTILTASAKTKLAKPDEVKTEINKEDVVTTMQGWAAAWSAQQVDLYLSFYDEQYHPTGISRQDWVNQRRIRLKNPKWVQVTLNDIEVIDNQGGQVAIQLVQRYRSNGYQDKTKKQFLLKKTMDGWRILSETSLALVK